MALMFIGGAPLSAAGGIKVTTFAIVFIFVLKDSLIYLSDISLLNKETVFSLHIAFKTKIKTIAVSIVLIWEILKLLPLYY
jgi:trk system potassium uptake protein TrkH